MCLRQQPIRFDGPGVGSRVLGHDAIAGGIVLSAHGVQSRHRVRPIVVAAHTGGR